MVDFLLNFLLLNYIIKTASLSYITFVTEIFATIYVFLKSANIVVNYK
jgi:hypothetical protein